MPVSSLIRGDDGPIVKRQKRDEVAQESHSSTHASRLFTPFRTIGLVSPTEVPFTSIPLGKTTFQITTSVGRCLQTYDLKRGLNLVFLTRPQTPEIITATLALKDKVLAAWGSAGQKPGIWVFKRAKKCGELDIPCDLREPVREVVAFGMWIIARCTTRIEIWRSDSYDHYTTIFSTKAGDTGHHLTALCNMPTYLNKIFAARIDGSIEIWNVSTAKLIYTILPPSSDCGSITALQASPALSLLAIAYSQGPLIIHDIRTDTTRLVLTSNIPISSISFRTDGMGAGFDGRLDGMMASAGPTTGDITFWDLNKGGRVMGVLRGAHIPSSKVHGGLGGGISRIQFLPGQPVIISSGMDNCLKSWIFDEAPFSPIPRILHSRSGHAAPITRLQFLPSDADGADAGGKWLLSASQDRSLWAWSLRRDGQNTELSQGSIKKKAKKSGLLAGASLAGEQSAALEDLKAPEIFCIASSLNRDGGMGAFAGSGQIWQKGRQTKPATDSEKSGTTGWESVVTGHVGDKYARTWFWGRKRAGRWSLETGDSANVSCVAISPCGTFAVIGSEAGGIDMFNLQSGLHRQRFPSRLTPAQARKHKIMQLEGKPSSKRFPLGTGKHTKAVTGVTVDALNKNVISCSSDGKIKFWSFDTGELLDEIDWFPMTGITSMRYHPSSDLIALTCDDLSIRVVDTETKKTIRELWGCNEGIRDVTFSNDGRWIIAASGDGTIRVWDLPTGHLIDAIRLSRTCTALAFSGTGEFLATACDGELGINIWNNSTLFMHVPTRHITESEIAKVSAPTASGEGGGGVIESAFESAESAEDEATAVHTFQQLDDAMMTLSIVPKSRWQTLLHLDLIKQRNKPKDAPKVPEKAPFFLPSLEKPQPLAPTLSEDSIGEPTTNRSRIIKLGREETQGQPILSLRQCQKNRDYEPFISHLKTLSPSASDLEIRSLSSTEGQSDLVVFVNALTARLRQKRDYELVHAWMTVFLRIHGDGIAVDKELRAALKKWQIEQGREGQRLGDLVGYCSGVVGFLRSPRT